MYSEDSGHPAVRRGEWRSAHRRAKISEGGKWEKLEKWGAVQPDAVRSSEEQ